MSTLAAERPLDWAAAYSPDRITIAALLGVRALRYTGEGSPPAGPPIEQLSVTAVGSPERPSYHDSTGLYGFIRLPVGARRIEISDAARRILPWAITANVPDRSTIVAVLQAGVTPPASPPPLLMDVALRPAPGAPLPPGLTAIWGIVRDSGSGAPVPLARVACATVGGGSVVTYAQRDGGYVVVLPLEKPSSLAHPPVFDFPRALTLHAPKLPLLAALAGRNFVGALPADLDTLDPNAAGSPFAARQYGLRKSDGTLIAGPNPDLPVRAAQQSRWDIELLP
jgi:hypothetical protein